MVTGMKLHAAVVVAVRVVGADLELVRTEEMRTRPN